MKLPEGKTRLDLVKEGLSGTDAGMKKRGRLIVSIDRLKEDERNERRGADKDAHEEQVPAVRAEEPRDTTQRHPGVSGTQ